MVKATPVMTLQRLTLVESLFRLFNDPHNRRKFLRWLVGGTAGALLLLQLSRGFCRTPVETAQLLARFFCTSVRTVVQFVARGFKPKFPNWTLRFELLRGIMRDAADMFGERIVDDHHACVIRRQSEVFGSLLGWFARRQYGLRLETVEFNGLEHVWLKSSTTDTSRAANRLVILFYHGGGYAVLSPRMYISFCSALAHAVKQELEARGDINGAVTVDVFLANYRKLPEHQYPVPAEDAVTMYEFLLHHEGLEPSQIILAGDSAGGGLVMSTLLRVRDGERNLPLPRAAIVACPLADLTGDEDESEGRHCVLSPNITAASVLSYHPIRDDPSAWADASPVHCDLQGLPPVLLQSASLDALFQHSLRLAAKAKADGVTNWEVDTHEDVPHVFMVFPEYVLPYARVGIQRMAVFAADQWIGGIVGDPTVPTKIAREVGRTVTVRSRVDVKSIVPSAG
ncbi:hypothetical protein PHYBOEH_004702 [Phytophthora boehmeriae]|uniref:Alpha/beta hydrolase fold-3 domain-containing protein n=1 Tax=Phytophthora boehmeriae TaxID=109152 RepID=A0A8T1WL35_9STRA|nr:hypothetical protein PHYBOEH_004702 [Phytophthora boehmeriae]